MKRKTTTPPREKSKIVSLELKIHQMLVTVYVRRRFARDKFVWKSYQRISLASLRRLAQLVPTAKPEQACTCHMILDHLGVDEYNGCPIHGG